MTKIDTSGWGEFKVGELFDFSLSKDDIQPKNITPGTVNLVSAGSTNNGIIAKIKDENAKIWDGGTITMDMFGQAFYQEEPYHAVSHGRVNILTPKTKLDRYSGLFVVSALNLIGKGFGFEEMCTGSKLKPLTILLPQTPDHTPDFAYMSDFMRKIETNIAGKINTQKCEKVKIDTSKWKEFKVGELFEIKPTKSYKMRNTDLLDGGNTPVVVNSAFNNGIGGFTTQEPTEKGGIITFSDTVDANTIFYQEKPFAGYSHVQGVYPVGEWANEWNKYSLLFFASCFKSTALRYGFDYSNKFRRDVALELKVLLPVDSSDSPDWEYMSEFMRGIEEKGKARFLALNEKINN